MKDQVVRCVSELLEQMNQSPFVEPDSLRPLLTLLLMYVHIGSDVACSRDAFREPVRCVYMYVCVCASQHAGLFLTRFRTQRLSLSGACAS